MVYDCASCEQRAVLRGGPRPFWPSATVPNLAAMPGPRTVLRLGLELARLPRRIAALERRFAILDDAPRRRGARTSIAPGTSRMHTVPGEGPPPAALLDIFDRATR